MVKDEVEGLQGEGLKACSIWDFDLGHPEYSNSALLDTEKSVR